ncbi:unnamed protein product [Clonostachys rosea]|uniref:Uncharacterized protein n=1 Tax=Bionectria ochroleuca TaxID=29856 RepID=A0ABY6U593_BIOOC|nr:unnamed protein product [Clonostachys rosea]
MSSPYNQDPIDHPARAWSFSTFDLLDHDSALRLLLPKRVDNIYVIFTDSGPRPHADLLFETVEIAHVRGYPRNNNYTKYLVIGMNPHKLPGEPPEAPKITMGPPYFYGRHVCSFRFAVRGMGHTLREYLLALRGEMDLASFRNGSQTGETTMGARDFVVNDRMVRWDGPDIPMQQGRYPWRIMYSGETNFLYAPNNQA